MISLLILLILELLSSSLSFSLKILLLNLECLILFSIHQSIKMGFKVINFYLDYILIFYFFPYAVEVLSVVYFSPVQ
jgi:hypothetical protein